MSQLDAWVHPNDWAVLLRWPRVTTVLETIVFVAVAAVLFALLAVAVGFLIRRPLRFSRVLIAFVTGAAFAVASAVYGGLSSRSLQAACWRLGADGVPFSERQRCLQTPPQGFEGYYQNTLFGPSHLFVRRKD